MQGEKMRDKFSAEERERGGKRATITIVSANLLRWLGGLSSIPPEVVEAGRAVLQKAQQSGDIRDYRLYAFGQDLHLQINTLGQGLHNPKVHRLAYEVATAALTQAADSGLYRPLNGTDFFRLSPRERAMLDFAVKLTAEPWAIEEPDRAALRKVGFSARDIWDIAAVAGFFNMSNRVASATDMRPNSVYHGQAR